MKNKIGAMSMLLILSGCSAFNNDFSCNVPDGIKCKSISQVADDVRHEGAKRYKGKNEYEVEGSTTRVYINEVTDLNGAHHDGHMVSIKV